jgi:hypothetical protein
MGSLRRITCSALCAGILLVPSVTPVNGQTSRHEWLKRCGIVFIGRVVKVGDVSFAGVPRSARTVVVRVDEVLEKPPAVSLVKGDTVTVEVKEPSQFRDGARVTFYANGWIFGNGLAVHEVGHEASPEISPVSEPGASSPRREEFAQVRKELSDAELRSRVQKADMVVVGRVTAIRPQALRPVGAQSNLVLSEHDPDWQEAVVQVESGIKGARDGQEIVIRFPGSLDVAWYRAPKFKLGQEGTFVLQRDTLSGSPKAMLGGAEVDAYVAGSRQDVLPKNEAPRVRALVGS